MLAYLVIREGANWTVVFRLIPGQSATIGRAPTNQIVIKDERCSRSHAEIFLANGRWTLRDLESRNGTAVGGKLVKGDYALSPGEIIRIGRSQMAFVHDLSKAFKDVPESTHGNGLATTETQHLDGGTPALAESASDIIEPTQITHRRGETRYFRAPSGTSETGTPKVGLAAANLCRLAFDLAQAPDEMSMASRALTALFEGTQADAGAVLVLQGYSTEKEPEASALEVKASRSDTDVGYSRVSDFLANTVLKEGEAVLARNIMGDSNLASRDSRGDIVATSVICAPIRQGKKVFGLIHLYTTLAERVPDPDDLEFTLAVADNLGLALHNLMQHQRLADNLNSIQTENVQLREWLGAQSEIVGQSPLMAHVAQAVQQAAPSKATVLIRGESGVGKELIARALHFASPRNKGPFICLNCAALTESLLESELFGHEKGAFTGATERKTGKFEEAHRGTLMLDEIGEMSPAIQAKFLRVLEGHSFERVGGSEPIKVDVRVIAATNRDLERAVSENHFRRDLFFRLRVLEITVPALRKRPEDITMLTQYFLGKFNAETGRRLRGFTPRAMEVMKKYRWPGNVRELKNVVERAVVLARGQFIDIHDLSLSSLQTAGDTAMGMPRSGEYQPMSLEEVEKRHILATLHSTGWNKSQTASILGIERSTLDRKIRRYELVRESPRTPEEVDT
jgi:transcriptional regulator with GAF, ATPase, and Fis domain